MQSEPNPFSTRYVQPGAITYQRPDGRSLQDMADDFFDRCHGWASVIGPHGTGKSTLLASLREYLGRRSNVFAYRFSTTDRNFARLWSERRQWMHNNIVVVDGYEQLSFWARWRLCTSVRQRRASLLITAHQALHGFPVLWRTSIDENLAKELRDQLLASRPELRGSTDLEEAWTEARRTHPTDLRETLMSMYDWVELQKQKRLASHNNSRAV